MDMIEKLKELERLLKKMNVAEEAAFRSDADNYTVEVTYDENRALTDVICFLRDFRSLTK